MQAEPAPPTAIDCVRRGLWSLWANWELVPTVFLQTAITTILAVIGALLPLLVLGVGGLAWIGGVGPDWPDRLVEELTAGLENASAALAPLLVALLVATAMWVLAFLVYCYLQAGVIGILIEADRQAGPGAASWRAFRAFSPAKLHRLGRRFLWRYFCFYHLLAALALVWTLLLLVLALLALRSSETLGPTAAAAMGCGGLLPLGFLCLVMILWAMLATADLARASSGVWIASRAALSALGRRPGAVLLAWLLAAVGWTALGAMFMPLSWGIALGAGERWLVWLTARGLLGVAEWSADVAVGVALLAALVTLVRDRGSERTEAAA